MIVAYLLFILISIGFTWLVLWFAAGLGILLNPFITFVVVFLLLFYLMTRR